MSKLLSVTLAMTLALAALLLPPCSPDRASAQSGFFVRRIILPGAGHFWSSDPFESEPRSYAAMSIPRMIRFLESSL